MHRETFKNYVQLSLIIVLTVAGIIAVLHYTTKSAVQISQNGEATTTNTYDANQQEQIKELAAISPYCADYYTSTSTATDPSDFTIAHPLSYYTCGDFSDIQTMTLPNGKHLYFVAVNTSLDCGSGGCTYIPLLEVATGSVKRIRGFNTYSDDGSKPITPEYSKDTDGSVFGFLTFENKNDLVIAYVHDNASCGTENIYQILNGAPVLTATYDTCLAPKPTTLYVNRSLPTALTKYIDVGTSSE